MITAKSISKFTTKTIVDTEQLRANKEQESIRKACKYCNNTIAKEIMKRAQNREYSLTHTIPCGISTKYVVDCLRMNGFTVKKIGYPKTYNLIVVKW